MGIDQIASEALRLPARERALLAASLWESLQDPNQPLSESTESETVATAIQRDEEMENGLAQPISHDELMSRLRG